MGTSVPSLGEKLIEATAIRSRVIELAAGIDRHYRRAATPVVLLCVLKGALIFAADLARELTVPLEIDFITLRSYGAATVTDGDVELVRDATSRLAGRDILIVEDIVDTGHTLAFLEEHLAAVGARSVRLVTLLEKRSRRAREVRIDWRGFEVPDRFVVGYGLDHDELFRNLPDVHVLAGV